METQYRIAEKVDAVRLTMSLEELTDLRMDIQCARDYLDDDGDTLEPLTYGILSDLERLEDEINDFYKGALDIEAESEGDIIDDIDVVLDGQAETLADAIAVLFGVSDQDIQEFNQMLDDQMSEAREMAREMDEVRAARNGDSDV